MNIPLQTMQVSSEVAVTPSPMYVKQKKCTKRLCC